MQTFWRLLMLLVVFAGAMGVMMVMAGCAANPPLPQAITATDNIGQARGDISNAELTNGTLRKQIADQLHPFNDLMTKQHAAADMKLASAETNVANLSSQLSTAQANAQSALHKALVWIIIAAILGVGLGVVALQSAWGSAWGMSAILGSAAVLGVALAVWASSPVLPWIAGALGVMFIGYVAYQIFVKKQAITQLVQTAEAAKGKLDLESKNLVFGPIADFIQSKTTQKMVKRARATLPLVVSNISKAAPPA